jgi:hypothetical protein
VLCDHTERNLAYMYNESVWKELLTELCALVKSPEIVSLGQCDKMVDRFHGC